MNSSLFFCFIVLLEFISIAPTNGDDPLSGVTATTGALDKVTAVADIGGDCGPTSALDGTPVGGVLPTKGDSPWSFISTLFSFLPGGVGGVPWLASGGLPVGGVQVPGGGLPIGGISGGSLPIAGGGFS